MNRVLISLIVILLAMVSTVGFAQSLFPSLITGIHSQAMSVGWIKPSVKVGYGNMGLNFNIPMAADSAASMVIPVDFSLKNANTWTGTLGLDLPLTQSVCLFANGEASAARTVIGVTDVVTPPAGGSMPLHIEWTGQKFQWWTLEGGGSFCLRDFISLLCGLRREQITTMFQDPRDSSGFLQTVTGTYSGDILLKMWIPYAGVRLKGSSYRANLLYSPFITTSLKLPLEAFLVLTQWRERDEILAGVDVSFSRKWGTFLEASLEQDFELRPCLKLSLWGKVGYLRVAGKGSEAMNVSGRAILYRANGTVRRIDPIQASDDGSTGGTLTRELIEGGISASLIF